ncbi:hypothetical protein, partial [Prosthecochloris sp. ZM_2]|uniref:hypothetical protein n=1 Tax=Prosthecochloris sp. ZM_2 TaxID=2045206 RepID=UPI001F2063A3
LWRQVPGWFVIHHLPLTTDDSRFPVHDFLLLFLWFVFIRLLLAGEVFFNVFRYVHGCSDETASGV